MELHALTLTTRSYALLARPYIDSRPTTLAFIPRPSPPPVFNCLLTLTFLFLHTASDQKLEAKKAWERDYCLLYGYTSLFTAVVPLCTQGALKPDMYHRILSVPMETDSFHAPEYEPVSD